MSETNAPERIYLQYYCNGCDDKDCLNAEPTWCQDKINDNDVEYVRADLVITEESEE